MAKPHAVTALTLSLVLAACAGPTQPAQPAQPTTSLQPFPSVTLEPTSGPTATPLTAAPTPTAATSPTPTNAPTVASTVAPLLGWTERTDVAPGPSAREDHTWTVNEERSVAYLFGGRGPAGTVLGDLWEFDLTTDTWAELRPQGSSPAGRFGHTATWVSGVGLVIWSGQGSRFFDDIWRYDPVVNAWEELPKLGDVPQARYGSCASLGVDGHLWISHGFTADDGRFADTRSYNFTSGTWTDRTPTTGDLPVSRCLHDCYWSTPETLVLYGGQTTGVTALGDRWAYDRTQEAWTQVEGTNPPARNLYALATNGSPDDLSAIVFGGGSEDGGFLDDTWLLAPGGGGAVPLRTPTSPGARSSATAIADDASRVLLFGGMNENGVLGDLWELSLNT